jgi:hypothetical protein
MKKPDKPYSDKYFREMLLQSGCFFVDFKEGLDAHWCITQLYRGASFVCVELSGDGPELKLNKSSFCVIKDNSRDDEDEFLGALKLGRFSEMMFMGPKFDVGNLFKMGYGQWLLKSSPKGGISKKILGKLYEFMSFDEFGMAIHIMNWSGVSPDFSNANMHSVFFGRGLASDISDMFPSRELWVLNASPKAKLLPPDEVFSSDEISFIAARADLDRDLKMNKLLPFSLYVLDRK